MLLKSPSENWIIPIAIALSFGCVHLIIISIPPTSDVECTKTLKAKIMMKRMNFLSHSGLSHAPLFAFFIGRGSKMKKKKALMISKLWLNTFLLLTIWSDARTVGIAPFAAKTCHGFNLASSMAWWNIWVPIASTNRMELI